MRYLHSGFKIQLQSAEYINTSYTPNKLLRHGRGRRVEPTFGNDLEGCRHRVQRLGVMLQNLIISDGMRSIKRLPQLE